MQSNDVSANFASWEDNSDDNVSNDEDEEEEEGDWDGV